MDYYEQLYWLVQGTNFRMSDIYDMSPTEKDFIIKYHTEIAKITPRNDGN